MFRLQALAATGLPSGTSRRDPRTAGIRTAAIADGPRACWCEPIVAANGSVLGAFVVHYRQRRRVPTAAEIEFVVTAVRLPGRTPTPARSVTRSRDASIDRPDG